MLPTPCYLFSDVHLGVAPAEAEASLLGFLRNLPADARALVINGDLYDFWFEWKHVVPRAGVRVLGELARLRDGGLPILWVAGNHDCWGGDILRKDLGLTYHVGPWRGMIGTWDAVVEHGDGLREKEDAAYRRLRAVLRHPLCVRLFRWIHPDWGTAIALRSSHTSRNYRARDGGEGLRKVAHARLSEPGAPQLVVLGHSHVAAMEAVRGGVFANPGPWLDAPRFLRITDGLIEACRWTGTTYSVEETLPSGRVPSGTEPRP